MQYQPVRIKTPRQPYPGPKNMEKIFKKYNPAKTLARSAQKIAIWREAPENLQFSEGKSGAKRPKI